jgi:hypothetical protein
VIVIPSCSRSESKSSNLRAATLRDWVNPGMVRSDIVGDGSGGTWVSSQLFDVNIPTEDAGAKMVPGRKGGIVRAVYVAAIGLATIGWLWFIAWVALKLL